MTKKQPKEHIPRRYLHGGHVVDTFDSRIGWGDPEHDHVVLRLILRATKEEPHEGAYCLSAYVECDVLNDDPVFDSKYITDACIKVFEIPFPYDPRVRRAIIASIRAFPSQYYRLGPI